MEMKITMTVTNEDQQAREDGQPPSNADKPNGEMPNGNRPQNGEPGNFKLTGEEKTVTINDSTIVTIKSSEGDLSGTLSDLKTGDIITVEMSGETATSITVMQMGMGGMRGISRQDGTPS